MESYYGCCGRCAHCNLYVKNGSHFKCEEVSGRWVLATEKSCNKFVINSRVTAQDIEYAREHRQGLASR